MRVDLWNRELRFGQYRGKRIEDVPVSYLTWTLQSIEDLEPEERRVLQAEVLDREARANRRHQRRQDQQRRPFTQPSANLPAGVTPDVLLRIISAGKRTLAAKYHPDLAGGDTEAMRAINASADFLTQQARALSQQQAGGAR